ncbi:RNA-binding protein, putative [Plasmodium knowlesi strain H]|uniref:RNA-binding protein, putative n=3 Tax=Plasmodium knowlesi TaxID=5850 RepID=A0A5K1U0S7_PLAKH|nr:RNA-binding protein, putative [Plasmodium knowlesi strain H]OTN64116.1 putative RNA-binding protein [Plasmodium knowlesi]CAA9990710.1 RNA-binding protein, putative [Plasmodium knowlesi strain H]SBO25886.1 RNA-binding protein, putative [Plasmodium knowlesi strain H]SBO28647.1 RNA-binding protein, putative [Plasmodium knowlesi strain H]VVS80184.1 RNA-binding protein, putative [Plasmodium knowlesi strain H]|eukprot:XP_002262000.1 RNA-binding protein, putative [Plasmodium knowlesi strain H]
MAFTHLCGIQAPQTPSTINTFLTKAQHDITLTAADTRIFIKNIKTGVTIDQFKNSLEQYGAMQVYFYEPGTNDDGWAWVGFESKEAAQRVVEESEKARELEEANNENSENDNGENGENNENNPKDEENERGDSNSFYAENDDENQNEEEDEDSDDY